MNVLNHLALIQQQHTKAQRLAEAQRLSLKAYRGVPYVEAHSSEACSGGTYQEVYRGIQHTVVH
ncbi:hypothetical protein [Vulcanococcus sp.]|uniref:hypothetical protein n=1 Tax=Vulcanococcus sp. TaxID=2856995 RepID=UPI003C09DF81